MPRLRDLLRGSLIIAATSCGPSARLGGEGDGGTSAPCSPGLVEDCYTGPAGTEDVGICRGGERTCENDGQWSLCRGEVRPQQEVCSNGLDENCSGGGDEDVDEDGDGFSGCAGDCCDGAECTDPALVNPGAYDTPGNTVDDDCDGSIDNTAVVCDSGLGSNSLDAMDYARAIDLCQTTSESSLSWGVISAALVRANGSGAPAPASHSIRTGFGTGIAPLAGGGLAVFSTGHAADVADTNPGYQGRETANMGTSSAFPQDWLVANGGTLPNAPACPDPEPGEGANDPVMLSLRIRAPSNARSFSLKVNFLSYEYPEWACSSYNDFFVVLLDSGYAGVPANPADKNLAFYESPAGDIIPVGVNLAQGNTGLFRQCRNGPAGCAPGAIPFSHSACTSIAELAGTGFDEEAGGACASNALSGGGTGWLTTSGNIVGGEVFTLRIAIWDTSDHSYDSTVLLDNFAWSVDAAEPGTIIE
jgi:hypothetical protein